jgi:hypothetical protein
MKPAIQNAGVLRRDSKKQTVIIIGPTMTNDPRATRIAVEHVYRHTIDYCCL